MVEAGLANERDGEDALTPGTKLGDWRVEYELGRGGMGVVYAVVHELIGKRAALKVVHRRMANASSPERLLLEAKVVNEISHANIVDIFEVGRLGDGGTFLVMERLEGESLAQHAKESKVITDRAIDILLQVCAAVAAAHDAGVVHRDLKPENVFLVRPRGDELPHVKVLDWGIAKVLGSSTRHTSEGLIVGSPHYVAPELVRGLCATTKSDVYSLGVMAFELLLEEQPFDAPTIAEIMVMHLNERPPHPSELWPAIPAALEDLLLEMLAKEPQRRPTVAEVQQRLSAIAATYRSNARRAAPLAFEVANAHRLVEDHLRGHPGVADVAVVGDRERIALALVTLAAGQRVSDGDLMEHCRAAFPERLCPKRITVMARANVTFGR